MAKVRVAAFSISIDGYGAGPSQSLEQPRGVGGMDLHRWVFSTRTFQALHGERGTGATGADDDLAASSVANLGAWILGRNTFGPVHGPRPNLDWQGWWGDEPPYHCPVFVFTRHVATELATDVVSSRATASGT